MSPFQSQSRSNHTAIQRNVALRLPACSAARVIEVPATVLFVLVLGLRLCLRKWLPDSNYETRSSWTHLLTLWLKLEHETVPTDKTSANCEVSKIWDMYLIRSLWCGITNSWIILTCLKLCTWEINRIILRIKRKNLDFRIMCSEKKDRRSGSMSLWHRNNDS